MPEQTRRRSPRGSGEELRGEIIAAARDLMAKAATSDDVSIRSVAGAVGVTAPSIYLHFADKQELISAVVVDVFDELDQAMVTASQSVPDPLDRLQAMGLAYVRFAIDYPEHYRVATMDPCPRPDVDLMLAQGCFVHFQEVVAECVNTGVFAPGDITLLTIELWAAAHGIAALLVAKPDLPVGDPMLIADRVLTASAVGHLASPS
ncbi:TetR family transcriptional regulator [Nocardioides baekrokdamisoli]|uniref:TetR family transcriptional regulator n=1 Tax=Nocardioides baekrokdamisoli TaxID=1804624 RepID=A0A3G9IZW9_9ACTN|nr:TetR/AcrR family transcriptional regulator [Nocardioides baekrokdamisoli]BBH16269.1 TetR family transcriptional regulator [Nocardioides baekrokdamisoli]